MLVARHVIVIIRFALGKKNLLLSLADDINLYFFAQVKTYTPVKPNVRITVPWALPNTFPISHFQIHSIQVSKFLDLEFPRDLNVYNHWTCGQYKNTEPHTGEYSFWGIEKVPGAITQRENESEDRGWWQKYPALL